MSSAPASVVPSVASRACRSTSASRSGEARSALVTATTPRSIAEKVENRQMLAGLRHDPVVGGDRQQGVIDRR